MDKKQKIVLLATASVLILMLFFPPCKSIYQEIRESLGITFIFIPWKPLISSGKLPALIDTPMWFVQYLFTITIGGILWFAFKDKDHKK